jgi:hypothetical protein
MTAPNIDDALPGIKVSDRHRQIQVAAFALLLDHGEPVTNDRLAVAAALTAADVADLLADFDADGRARFDDEGRLIGIAGLSIEPTRHRLDIGDTTRWTWCALDAIGILGAVGRDATYTTQLPDTDDELTVAFTANGPAPTDTVVFMASGYGNDSVVDTWCPTVNLFADADGATIWANAHAIDGQPIPVTDLAADAAAIWMPIAAGSRRVNRVRR